MHHSHAKRWALNLGLLLSCPLDGDFAWEVLEKWASSALRNMTSFLPGAQNERPPSRIRALPPTPALRTFSYYAPGWRFRVGCPRKMGLRAETHLYCKRNAFSHFRPRAHLAHSTIYLFFAHLPHQMHIFAPTYPPTSKRHGRCRKKAPGKYPPHERPKKSPNEPRRNNILTVDRRGEI